MSIGGSRTGAAGSSAASATYNRYGAAASASTTESDGGDVDLATEQVEQLSSLRAFQANVAVLDTETQMQSELLRIKA